MRALRFGEIVRRRELNRWRHDGSLLAQSERHDRVLRTRALAALLRALRPRRRCKALRIRRLH
jgi:hypothetical protein